MEKVNVYLSEVKIQIGFAKESFRELKNSTLKPDIPSIFMHIHHFLIHVSNIDKILDVDNNNFRRVILGDALPSVNLKPFRKVRNHLEHFDERLDKWIKNYDGHAFFDMNLISGTKGFPERAFLRALDGMIFKFHGESYDLEKLAELIDDIENQMKDEYATDSLP